MEKLSSHFIPEKYFDFPEEKKIFLTIVFFQQNMNCKEKKKDFKLFSKNKYFFHSFQRKAMNFEIIFPKTNQRWANSVLMTEYEYKYYSVSQNWLNMNTNIREASG